jgi:hypothetical protein
VLLDPQCDEQVAVIDACLTMMHMKAVSRIVGPAKATIAFENSFARAAEVPTEVNRSAVANLQLALAGRAVECELTAMRGLMAIPR